MAVDDTASAQHGHEDVSDLPCKTASSQSGDVDVKRYFYLKNSETRNLVLDVEGMKRSCGSPVILWDQKFSTDHHPDMLVNQLWYEDPATSTIRTAMNDFCLDLYGQ